MMCVQITTDDESMKQGEESSCRSSLTGRVRLFTHGCLTASLKSKRQVKAECSVNSVGANVDQIQQLHRRNSLFYLRTRPQVEAAGEYNVQLQLHLGRVNSSPVE